MKQIFFFLLLLALEIQAQNTSPFAKAKGTQFEIAGKPYYFIGANFWAGMNLGSTQEGGNRARLIRELDKMKALGITNLRIIAGSEGPHSEPYRIIPSLQISPNVYDENLLDGLDFVLAEMGKRKMYAVMCLNDYWQWSGGFGQYLVWAKHSETIPYPEPHPGGGTWQDYVKFLSDFYSNQSAQDLFKRHIAKIVNRVNSITQKPYKEDPTIFAWELANEPRGSFNEEAYRVWLQATARYIKSLDVNHMVTTGSEGKPLDIPGNDFLKDHAFPEIDYTTVHIWVQNWSWYDPKKAEETYPKALQMALDAIQLHIDWAKQLNKPLVLEEFGIARDDEKLAPNTPITYRDRYYKALFEKVWQSAKSKTPLVGVNFWAWGGEGVPAHKDWQKGDDFLGDPPHEPQGWYSVYQSDKSTFKIIQAYAKKLMKIK